MSIGTGLFLSTVILSVVLLYGFTKDRWRWKVGIKRTSIGVFATILIGVIAWGGLYIWNHLPTTLTPQTEYVGLHLGMSPDEVMYVKGYPPIVLGKPVRVDEWTGFFLEVIETKKLEKGKTVNDFQYWVYDSIITVEFDNAKKAIVKISCNSSNKLNRCPALAGVIDGDSEKEAIRKLGNPDRAEIMGLAKYLYYRKFGIELILTKEQVYHLSIVAPTESGS